MSKVKIQPNASGTGIFSIAAPATNTDRTLTLPDVDATVLTSAGGTINGKFNIDGTQAIGPSSAANLSEATTLYAQKLAPLRTGSNYGLYIGNSGLDSAYFQVATTNASSAGTIKLNPFGGAVLMPYQPAFRGFVAPDQTTAGEMLSNWTIQYNRGNHFSGGRLTAPVAGVYHVSAAIDASGSPSRVKICVNGSTMAMNEPTITNDGWETINITTDVYCNASDYISLIVDNGTGANPYHMGGGYWGWFNIHFVG